MIKNEIGACILRIVLGGIFIIHGLAKFQGGITETISRFESYNIPYAEVVGYSVVGVEVIGGFFLIIGFSTRFISLLFIAIMIGAIVTVTFEQGFLNGYEYNIALIGIALYLLLAGSRFLALDGLFIDKKKTSNKRKNKFRS
ncbi:DoxX family protein [Lysinibacillus sp. 54212]|uniref:DoxX family protein n=1 Tax=Lysinibacillus sp. 54212 TaxID=3119829 RepID=UPI002FC72790